MMPPNQPTHYRADQSAALAQALAELTIPVLGGYELVLSLVE